jgi:hypothetical protein
LWARAQSDGLLRKLPWAALAAVQMGEVCESSLTMKLRLTLAPLGQESSDFSGYFRGDLER